jgi:alpha-1,4-fucosyltransferase
MLVRKRINYVAPMLASAAILLLLLSGCYELPSTSSLTAAPASRFPTALDSVGSRDPAAFTSLLAAFRDWDAAVGCPRVRAKIAANATAVTGGATWGGARCEEMPPARHVGVLVKGWTWIPDALDGVYTCRCGVSCVWSKSAAAVDRPDAMLFEGATPPPQVLRLCPPYFLVV